MRQDGALAGDLQLDDGTVVQESMVTHQAPETLSQGRAAARGIVEDVERTGTNRRRRVNAERVVAAPSHRFAPERQGAVMRNARIGVAQYRRLEPGRGDDRRHVETERAQPP